MTSNPSLHWYILDFVDNPTIIIYTSKDDMCHSYVTPENRLIDVGKHEQSLEMVRLSAPFVLVPQLAGEFSDTFIAGNFDFK